MNLLFNAKDLLEAVPTGTEENSAELKETILEFLAEDDARISLGDIIFGATNPEGIKSVAGDWNKEILSGLMKEINGIMANPAAFTLDSTASFRLFGAARLADDRFSIWGDAGIMWGVLRYRHARCASGRNPEETGGMGPCLPDGLLRKISPLPNTGGADFCAGHIF